MPNVKMFATCKKNKLMTTYLQQLATYNLLTYNLFYLCKISICKKILLCLLYIMTYVS